MSHIVLHVQYMANMVLLIRSPGIYIGVRIHERLHIQE